MIFVVRIIGIANCECLVLDGTGSTQGVYCLRGMSEKARGKLPAGAQSFARQNSSTSLSSPTAYTSRSGFTPTSEWLESWLPDLPLHTMLTIIKALSPKLPSSSSYATDSAASSRQTSLASHPSAVEPSLSTFLHTLPDSAAHPLIGPILASPSPIRVHLFEWSPLSLGWYMSVLWSLIFTAEMTIAPTSTTANTLTGTGGSAGPVGTWNGTNVKLFAVATEGMRAGPSLSAPRGAVDAVGSRLVQGVQGLGLGNLIKGVGGGAGQARERDGGGRGVREV